MQRLRRVVRGEVSDGTRRRAEYSSDAGNYRVLPQVVVTPADTDDVLAVLAVSRATGVPVTGRGGGTSIAGNAIGTGIVLDFARRMNRVLDLDPEAGPQWCSRGWCSRNCNASPRRTGCDSAPTRPRRTGPRSAG